MCGCGSGTIENMEHFLIHCLQYERQYARLRKQVGIGGMWIEKLLGDPELVQYMLDFIKNIKRFDF